MRREAQNLGVSGWVRNRSDGSVEAVVSGESTAMEAIVRWAKHGPVQAQVERVEVEPYGGSYTSFEIIY